MCIQVKSFETLEEDLTVWKTVRRSRTGNWFLSYFPPGWRAAQQRPAGGPLYQVWQSLGVNSGFGMLDEGNTKRYTIGTTHTSKEPGMYCFEHYKQAHGFANRGYSSRPVLKCTIPKGTLIVKGIYEGGLTIVTRKLRVEKEVHGPLASA